MTPVRCLLCGDVIRRRWWMILRPPPVHHPDDPACRYWPIHRGITEEQPDGGT